MSDQEARALGAGDSFEVAGRELRLAPIGMRQLHEVQRAAVAYYKREYLSTYAENLDLLPAEKRDKIMEQKVEEVAHWDIGRIPPKFGYDVRHVHLTTPLLDRLTAEYGDLPTAEAAQRALLATLLDAERITIEEVFQLAGGRPRRAKIPYDTWWVTAVFEGMIMLVWSSVKISHPDVTRAAVGQWPLGKLAEAARLVERLTAPSLGNT